VADVIRKRKKMPRTDLLLVLVLRGEVKRDYGVPPDGVLQDDEAVPRDEVVPLQDVLQDDEAVPRDEVVPLQDVLQDDEAVPRDEVVPQTDGVESTGPNVKVVFGDDNCTFLCNSTVYNRNYNFPLEEEGWGIYS
jgi:hypothetical protein